MMSVSAHMSALCGRTDTRCPPSGRIRYWTTSSPDGPPARKLRTARGSEHTASASMTRAARYGIRCSRLSQKRASSTRSTRRGGRDGDFAATPKALARLERGAVVELQHAHVARGRGLDAELAEHALVEVLLDHLDAAVAVRVDVDGAGVLELLRELRVVADVVGHLDVDEGPWHQPIFSLTRSGISEISSATVIPASFSRLIFSAAVSALPSTMVPAWPKLMPGISSMKRPAMKATIGSLESFSVT